MLDRWNEQLEKHSRLAGWLLPLITFVVFRGTLANGLVYDDEKYILHNPFVRNARLWRKIFTGGLWSFLGAGQAWKFYRPLHIASYWALYRVGGTDPALFHLFQLLLYTSTVVVVYWLGRELLSSTLAAFAGAVLWALHPLHVEPVAWLSGLPDVGCGFFFLLAFTLFVRAENADADRSRRHMYAALAYLPSTFYKEMGLGFPLLILAYWFFFPPKERWWKSLLHLSFYLGAALVYVVTRVAVLGRITEASHFWRLSLGVVEAPVALLGQHARQFFWPVNLNVFHEFELNQALRSPWPWLTLLLLIGAVVGLRRKQPLLAFLIVWWAVTMLPVLDIRQLNIPLVAERFSYIPSVGLCLAIAFVGLVWLPKRFPDGAPALVVLPALAALLVFWSVQDLRSIPNWSDNQTLWAYSLRASPNSAPVHFHHALVLQFVKGDLDGAAREFQNALRLNEASFEPLATVTYDSYVGLGQIANLKGNTAEAVEYFQKALRVSSVNSDAFDFLGSVYFPRQDYVQAAVYFQRAVRVNAYDLSARFYLGTCWLKLGRPREAAEQFHAAREVDPTFYQAYEAEARAWEAVGDAAQAARVRAEKPQS